MDIRSRGLALWRRLADPADWSRRQAVGEVALSVLLALTAAGPALLRHDVWPAVFFGVVVALLSPLRRVLPSTVLVAAGVLGGLDGAGLLLITASWSAGYRIHTMARTAVAFGCSGLCLVLVSVAKDGDWSDAVLTGSTEAVLFLVFAVIPGLVNRNRMQRKLLLRTLTEHNVQLLRERDWVVEQAQVRERQRIAHDMHDSLGHQLTLIAVHAGALEVDPTVGEVGHAAVGVVRRASVSAMEELRSVVGILAQPAPGQTSASPLGSRGVGGIGELVATAGTAGTEVQLQQSGDPRPIPTATGNAAYRIVQEGLTNIYKHAPGAAITVQVCYEPDALVVEVANGPVPPGPVGASLTAVGGGQGLTGLQERVRLAGGMLHTGPTSDGGFRLAGVLPYRTGPAAGPVDGPTVGLTAGSGAGLTAGMTTLVSAAHDFGEQPSLVPLGDGDPDDTRPHPYEEFANTMTTKRTKGCLTGCGIVLVAVLAIATVVFFKVDSAVHQAADNIVDQKTYDAVQVGQSEASVRRELPSGKSLLITALLGKLPADPPGQTCLNLKAAGTAAKPLLGKDLAVYRFCFQGGKLVGKSELDVTS